SSFWISDLSMRLPDAAIFLCGCKSDLLLSLSATTIGAGDDIMASDDAKRQRRRYVDSDMLRNFAREHSIPQERLFSVSAKTGHQVTELFEAVAACCLVTCRRKSLLHQKLHPKVVSEISTGDQQSPNTARDIQSLSVPEGRPRSRRTEPVIRCPCM
uniref:RAB34, member RAS oncogene family b n=1 Tax=Macrostomum lignano TaxID=282301 RepID=A0A1I8I4U8_9PLAT